ncbi:NTP transferase domain-containing protein [Reichenbachiella ulvae]|uniref:Probable molybdenum cofactor guanylyltransferase n=1 Tax=Reichenbachiella ulvae TaxID=2980104 RepID=A0ABT3CTR9_9BACT|nr:NTP transferase domain-containing protein [Reichenbachiella ulvae]MCV9386929.1 NTP transferase domain-containing protein [Reichenbachiella ulvae]
MTKKHQKHAKIAKPNFGEFARNEFSILGTPCGEIKKIANIISQSLSSDYKIAYADADHKSADDQSNLTGSTLAKGNTMEYVDKIDFHRFDHQGEMNPWLFRPYFDQMDLVIVNGNHFPAKQQIVVLDPKKPLEKKLHKLTHVALILTTESQTAIPDYLKEHLSKQEEDVPCHSLADEKALIDWVKHYLSSSMALINGLVLAGGKSERMQKDKTLIAYHGKAQKEHMYDLLSQLSQETYYSIREDQEENEACIKDSFVGLGPYGAILSAFRSNPNRAWLVTASDQPFLDESVLELLISKRNPSKVATAFYNPETDFPEPLITIWEPRAYPLLLQFLSQGYSCPRKVLINTDIELVKLEDASVLRNVNTPEEYEQAVKEIG